MRAEVSPLKTEMMLLMHYGKPTMTSNQVAALMELNHRSFMNMVYAKTCKIPMFQLTGSSWFAHVADVAKFIDGQRAAASAEILENSLA